jgi:hypothetical protein
MCVSFNPSKPLENWLHCTGPHPATPEKSSEPIVEPDDEKVAVTILPRKIPQIIVGLVVSNKKRVRLELR